MGRALRAESCDPGEICVVHCVQRAVRRAWLAGKDPVSGVDYSYRREWIRYRMEALASVFGIDVLTYAILSNHMHLVLRNRPDVVAEWSDQEVAMRWLKVFPGRRIEEHLGQPTEVDVQALVRDKKRLAEIRTRLSDISWFMRSLSEPIARMANKQDECTGRFWEGRFKAQRITDEAGLLACSLYVDLNPIRAAMAETIEQSKHTSAYDRFRSEQGSTIRSAAFDLVVVDRETAADEIKGTPVEELKERRRRARRRSSGTRVRRDAWLSPLSLVGLSESRSVRTVGGGGQAASSSGVRASDKGFLQLGWPDYLKLLRWAAKHPPVHTEAGQSEGPPKALRKTIASLGIDVGMLSDLVWNFKRYFGGSSCAGRPDTMSAAAEERGKRWARGQRLADCCFT